MIGTVLLRRHSSLLLPRPLAIYASSPLLLLLVLILVLLVLILSLFELDRSELFDALFDSPQGVLRYGFW